MNNAKPDFSAIDSLHQGMLSSLDDLDIETLKDQVENYNNVIRETFTQLKQSRLDPDDLQTIRQFLVRHQQLVKGVEYKRKNVAQELKKMKRGRDMQKTYRKESP